MKNIQSRVAKLEKSAPRNDIIVVIAQPGESKEDSIERVMSARKDKNREGLFIMYLNLCPEKNRRQSVDSAVN